MIYPINFDETANSVSVSMTLTTQFCPMGESIINAATQALQQVFPDDKVQLTLTFDPAWNAEMISEEGKKYLNH